MRDFRTAACACFLFLVLMPAAAVAAKWDLDATTGMDGGPGAVVSASASEFAEGLPFALRFGLGYAGREPGDGLKARAVFINNNTNGSLEENGRRWSYRLDAVTPIHGGFLNGTSFHGGVRLSRFAARFNFVDGNEDFAIRTTQWGLGAGIEKAHRINGRDAFVWSAGADWFFASKLEGHGTSYAPDGTSINPHEDFGWADADLAVHQPRFVPRVMLGVRRSLGVNLSRQTPVRPRGR